MMRGGSERLLEEKGFRGCRYPSAGGRGIKVKLKDDQVATAKAQQSEARSGGARGWMYESHFTALCASRGVLNLI